MFNELVEIDNIMLENTDVMDMIAEASNEMDLSLIIFAETSNVEILNEASSIVDKFIKALNAIIAFVRRIFTKIVAFSDSKLKNIESLLKKYEEQIGYLTDEDLSELIYDKIGYKNPVNIPAPVSLPLVVDGLKHIGSSAISRNTINDLNRKLTMELSIARGRIMGLNGPVSIDNFDNELVKLFRSSEPIFNKVMTKHDLVTMIDELKSFSSDKISIKTSRNTITNTLNQYKTDLTNIYSMVYTSPDGKIDITLASDKKITTDTVGASYYRAYQSILTTFIMDVSTVYTNVFNAKLKSLKEKIENYQDIVRQVVYLVNDK